MTKNIYIVVGHTNGCEGVEVLSAFTNREDAEQFVKECEDWDKAKPDWEQLGFDEYHLAWGNWKDNHPCGDWLFDYYEVQVKELK